MSLILENAIFTGLLMIAFVGALGLMLVSLLLTTIYLGIEASKSHYHHFFSDALVPALQIAFLQLLSFGITVFFVGLVSIPIACVAGYAVGIYVQVSYGQRVIHGVIGSGLDIRSTQLFGAPSANTLLLLCIPTAAAITLIFYGVAALYQAANPSPYVPSDVRSGRYHHAEYQHFTHLHEWRVT